MLNRVLLLGSAILIVASPTRLAAQTMITFEAPVKLTDLAPEILKVSLYCEIKSPAITLPNGAAGAADELPVTAGQIITTFRVAIEFPQGSLQAPVGKTANYQCYLRYRTATGMTSFDALPSTSPLALKPSPVTIQGSFVW
jgi:hypothetical protein